jgi:hypothetical protein
MGAGMCKHRQQGATQTVVTTAIVTTNDTPEAADATTISENRIHTETYENEENTENHDGTPDTAENEITAEIPDTEVPDTEIPDSDDDATETQSNTNQDDVQAEPVEQGNIHDQHARNIHQHLPRTTSGKIRLLRLIAEDLQDHLMTQDPIDLDFNSLREARRSGFRLGQAKRVVGESKLHIKKDKGLNAPDFLLIIFMHRCTE